MKRGSMTQNNRCVYCRKELNRIENDPLCRSVEHMIANTITTRKRNNGEGDFYVCRSCNGQYKSLLDKMLAMFSRVQSGNESVVLSTIEKEASKPTNGKVGKAMVIPEFERGILTYPNMVSGQNMVDYIDYIAKGVHFMSTGKLFNEQKMVIIPSFLSKAHLYELECCYRKNTGRNAFEDMKRNDNLKYVDDEYVIIEGSKNNYLVLIHDYTGFSIKIKSKNNLSKGESIRARKLIINNVKSITYQGHQIDA